MDAPNTDKGAARDSGASASRTLNVVIVSYNCVDLLASCLSSLRTQTLTEVLRIIVVDNASDDGTPQMVQEHFPEAILIRNQTNAGFGKASNQGLLRRLPGHVLLLNPDTIVPKGGLAAALTALCTRPEVGMLGCRLVQPSGEVDHASRRSMPTPSSSLAYFLGIRSGRSIFGLRQYVDPAAYEREGPADAINGAFMLIREDALADVGGFDEDFWMYGEDLDLCLRMRAAGWVTYYWPGIDVVHVKGGSSGKLRRPRVNWAFHYSMWLFYRKHYSYRYTNGFNLLVALGITGKFLLSILRVALLRGSRQTVQALGGVHN